MGVVKLGTTDDEMYTFLDNLEESDSRVFQQSIIQSASRGNSKAVLRSVKSTSKLYIILKINNRNTPVVHLLVEVQGDSVDMIEKTASTTELKGGNQLFSRAVRLAKSTRTVRTSLYTRYITFTNQIFQHRHMIEFFFVARTYVLGMCHDYNLSLVVWI